MTNQPPLNAPLKAVATSYIQKQQKFFATLNQELNLLYKNEASTDAIQQMALRMLPKWEEARDYRESTKLYVEELKQIPEMVENAEKLFILIHELRAPFTMLGGYLQLFLQTDKYFSDPNTNNQNRRDSIQQLQKATNRLIQVYATFEKYYITTSLDDYQTADELFDAMRQELSW